MNHDEPEQPPNSQPQPPPDTSLEPGMPSSPAPAWHRTPVHPEDSADDADESGRLSASSPPPAGPPPAGAPPAAAPGTPGGPPRATGGHLAAGVFLTVAGISIFSGLIDLLDAQRVGFPANAIACGIAFVALFVAAVGWRGGASPMRGLLGVVSVFFLVACFAFAVDIAGAGTFAEQSLRVRMAGAAAVFAVGQLMVGVVVPSSVASGLGVLGLVGTVELSIAAWGSPSGDDLLAAGMATATAVILLALRVGRLRPHPTGLAWMVGVAAVLATLAGMGLAIGINGVAAAAVGLLTLGLALVAWRHRFVAPAVAAVPGLMVVEAYAADRLAGSGTATGRAVVVLASGAVLLILVAMGALVARQWKLAAPTRRVLVEEVLLAAAAVLALVALTLPSHSALPFLRGGLG